MSSLRHLTWPSEGAWSGIWPTIPPPPVHKCQSLRETLCALTAYWTQSDCFEMWSPLSLLFVASSLALPALSQRGAYQQCGGTNWSGVTTCVSGYTCVYANPFYSQCQPGTVTISSSSTTTSSSTSHSTSSSHTSSSSSTLTGIAATAPTTPPSKAVGRLPALGWNGWNAYGCAISADKVLSAAQSFVDLGLQKAGYEYVNIDDCWAEMSRDPTTQQQVPDSTKFPNGIKALADQVHSMGLKIGIYSDAGTNTCAGYPGSLGYEAIDAAAWQSWDIDYVKYDNCNVPANWTDAGNPPGGDWYNSNSAIRYRQMGAALANNDPPVQFSLCIWGDANVWTWGNRVGHSWRMSGDAGPTWGYIASIMSTNVAHLSSINFFSHNDMDMMEIGNGNLSIQEERTHFAVWAFMKSPILLGTTLSALNSDQVAIITNAELLAFHQDATIGTPATPFTSSTAATTNPPQFYAGRSVKGTHVFIVNTNSTSTTFDVNFADIPGLEAGKFKVHDMWKSADLGTFSGAYNVTLAAHDTAALLITS
ncbi:glycoside hydrolase superfamily [Gloeopeniophorella convolvens]|nr:glycoside hydrolase superfamily [Gloeopeniophorella convolvens]